MTPKGVRLESADEIEIKVSTVSRDHEPQTVYSLCEGVTTGPSDTLKGGL